MRTQTMHTKTTRTKSARTKTKLVLATLAAALSVVGLSACSGSSSDTSDSSSSSAAKGFNDADVSFAQDMIPHHRQATEMAALAAGRTTNQDVLDLAAQITAAQQPEIDTMTGWLTSWDKKVPSDMGGMSGMDHGSSSDMPGMMTDDQLSSLESSKGAAFDRAFLTMMTAHHEGALEMAATEEADGAYAPAVDLARTIQKTQTAEIATMKALLGS